MSDIIEVSEIELADYLGLSDRRIRQLFKQGVVIKSKRGKYDLKASIKSYLNFLRAKDEETKKNESLEKLKISKEAETLMHERLKKRKTELQVLQLEKKMHTSEDVEFFWNAMVMTAKSKITAIPVKCAPLLLGIEDRREAQAILKREIDAVLNELADYDIDLFESEYDDVFDDDSE